MSFIVDRLLRLAGFRASTAYNAGLPNEGEPNTVVTPFNSVGGQIKLQSLAGPIRAQPPTDYKPDGYNVRVQGFARHPVVSACIRVVTDIVSSIPLEVYSKSGDNEKLLPEHPLQKLLNQPSPMVTGKQLRSYFASDFLIYGNVLTRMLRPSPNRAPLELRRANPEGLQVVYADYLGDPVAYVITNHFGRVMTFSASDILHFRDINANSPNVPDIFGYPRAAAALVSIAADSEASRYVRQIVGNDGTPTLAVILENETSQEDASAMQERWHQLQVERGHRGRAAFMGGVKDVKPIGFNLRNLEFPDLRKVNREDICAAFGVDPRIIGIGTASNDGGLSGVQYVEARARLVQHTIEPMLYVFEDVLNLWLAAEFGDVHIRFNKEVLRDLVEDDKATSDRVRGEFKDGLRSFEEAREALRLSPDPKPDDAFMVGQTLMPAAMIVMQPEDTTKPDQPGSAQAGEEEAAGGDDKGGEPTPGGDDQEEKDEADAEKKDEEAQKKGEQDAGDKNKRSSGGPPRPKAERATDQKQLWRAMSTGVAVFTRGTKLTTEQRAALWKGFDARAKKDEYAYKSAALKQFSRERSSVKSTLNGLAAKFGEGRADPAMDRFIKAAQAKIEADYKPGAKYHQEWKNAYESLITRTYTAGATNFANALNLDFNLQNPRVLKAIERRVDKLASQVTGTSAQRIIDAIRAGRDAGMGIGQIAELVDKAAFGAMDEARATMIARTETVGAMNEGEFNTAKEEGVMAEKEWLTQQDDRVRDSHADLDGVRVGMDEEFDNGLQYPGDPSGEADEVINCRCTLLYYDDTSS